MRAPAAIIGPMQTRAVKRSLPLIAVLLGTWGLADAQGPPAFGNPSALSQQNPEAEIEKPPRFQVEVIAFSYLDFDPSQEQFVTEPRGSLLESLDPGPVELPPIEDSDAVELVPASGIPGTELSDPTGGPEFSDRQFSDTTFPGSGAPTGFDDAFGEEEEPGIAERFIATLLTLGEDPELLDPDAPLNPDTPLDPGAALDAALEDPAAPGVPDPGEDEFQAVTDVLPGALDSALGGVPGEALPETDEEEEPFVYRLLAADELELTGAYAMLENLDAYTPLVHGGWVQEGLPEDLAPLMHLSLLGALNPVGTVRLHLSRFLHVTVDLQYHVRPTEAPAIPLYEPYSYILEEVTLPPRYELHVQRQARSGELHYFDHPAFGVLVIVRPQPEEVEEPEELLSPPLGPAA